MPCALLRKIKGFCNRESGSALLLVVLAAAVLLVLGAGLGGLAVTELNISSNLEDSTRAYYLAESGIEAARGVLLEDGGFLGSFVLKLDETGESVVSVARAQGGGLEVTSTGTSGKASQKVHLLVEYMPAPVLPESYLKAIDLGWHCEQGWIVGTEPGNDFTAEDRAGLPVVFSTENAVGIKYEPAGGGRRLFKAPALFFEDEPACLMIGPAARLELHSEVIVFRGKAEINGALVLSSSVDEGIVFFEGPVLQGGREVYGRDGSPLEGGAYYFPGEGVELPSGVDRLCPALNLLWY